MKSSSLPTSCATVSRSTIRLRLWKSSWRRTVPTIAPRASPWVSLDRRLHLLALPRRGKIYALCAAVARARGDILVFSDANTMLHPQALRKLVRSFALAHDCGETGWKLFECSGHPKGRETAWGLLTHAAVLMAGQRAEPVAA